VKGEKKMEQKLYTVYDLSKVILREMRGAMRDYIEYWKLPRCRFSPIKNDRLPLWRQEIADFKRGVELGNMSRADLIACRRYACSGGYKLYYEKLYGESYLMYAHRVQDVSFVEEVEGVSAQEVVMERKKKVACEKELASLISASGKGSYWRGGYRLDFRNREYTWKHDDREWDLALTAGEQLYLFKWLALGTRVNDEWFYMANMRRKFGASFLTDMEVTGE
jgi:hypothetical protein